VEIFIKLFRRKLYDRKKFCLDVIGAAFWVVLVVALAVEFWGNVKAMRIADSINSQLDAEAGQARKDAGAAIERAALIESNNVALSWQVEELRSNNIVLEARLLPRTITPQQETNFISLCANIPKMPIKILIGLEDNETESFAQDVRRALDAAGFECPDGGFIRDQTLIMTRPLGVSNFDSELCIATGDKNVVPKGREPVVVPGMIFLSKNAAGERVVWTEGLDQIGVVYCVGDSFAKVGIPTTWLSQSAEKYLKTNEAAIYIPEKFH